MAHKKRKATSPIMLSWAGEDTMVLPPAPTSVAQSPGAISTGCFDIASGAPAKRIAEEKQRLHDEISQMLQNQANWGANVGGQVTMLLQHDEEEPAQHAARKLEEQTRVFINVRSPGSSHPHNPRRGRRRLRRKAREKTMRPTQAHTTLKIRHGLSLVAITSG